MPALKDALLALNAYGDATAWLVIGLFVTVAVLEYAGRTRGDDRLLAVARGTGAVAWVAFAGFWIVVFPDFYYEMKSPIESLLSLAAVPASVYAGYLLYSGRDSLFVLTRAVAFMGLIYFPFEAVPFLREWLVETVAHQVYAGIQALGYDPTFTTRAETGYLSVFSFEQETGVYETFIVLACTGIGSMAIFGGLVAAVAAPLRRKLSTLAVVIPTIWVLNIARNVFIAVAFGNQWLQVFVPQIQSLVGYDQPGMVSFFLADRVISQGLSVVALVVIGWFVVRRLPELMVVVEDVLFIATDREYDLQTVAGRPPARTDGDGR